MAQALELGLCFSRIIVPNGRSCTHAGLAAGMKAAGDEPSRIESFTLLAPVEKALAVTSELTARTLTLIDLAMTLAGGDIVVRDGRLLRPIRSRSISPTVIASRSMFRA